ncbi:hypothetical protein [Paenibacillus contaminans]|uniref:hypothetical protein n=1 Tax=Paenibacillus contaminans TaxID=450362 RepID=UPI0018652D6C|nr:hypothetical protein [Paenibacillus contaminans]
MTMTTRPNLPTREEVYAIRDSILLPMMLTICEKNLRELEFDRQPMTQLYIVTVNALMNRINADLTTVKKLLRSGGIKVVEDDRVAEAMIYYRFFCRGYNDIFGMTRDVVKAEISVRMGKYIGGLLQGVREGGYVTGHREEGHHDPI